METLWQFIAVGGTAASIAGVILAWQTRDTKQFIDRMDRRHMAQHAQTQAMLEQMDQRHLTQHAQTQAILERMDRAAEQRAETLRTLLERPTPPA